MSGFGSFPSPTTCYGIRPSGRRNANLPYSTAQYSTDCEAMRRKISNLHLVLQKQGGGGGVLQVESQNGFSRAAWETAVGSSKRAVSRGYSVRIASICLDWIFISTPRGGRTSLPCTIPPRTHTLPIMFAIFSGSYNV